MFQRSVEPLTLALLVGLLPSHAAGQADSAWRSWNRPFAPFRVMDSIHYVGGANVSSYLITSGAGHILIDGGFEETAPQILANIRRLGYDPSDVRFLLYSHAHHDHAGGLAALREATGAALWRARAMPTCSGEAASATLRSEVRADSDFRRSALIGCCGMARRCSLAACG